MRISSFAGKMAIIGGLFLLPVTVLVVLLYAQINNDVTFYRLERLGVTYTKTLQPLFADLEAYRLTEGNVPADRTIGIRIDADLSAVNVLNAGHADELKLGRPLAALKAKWAARADSSVLLGDFIVLLGTLADNSKITLDPVLDSYYIGDTMVTKMPSSIDSVAAATVLARRSLHDKSLRMKDRISLTILTGEVNTARGEIDHNLPIAVGTAPYLQATLDEPRRAARNASAAFTTWVMTHVLEPRALHASEALLAPYGAAALTRQFALYGATIAGMADILQRRIDDLTRWEVTIFVGVFGALAVAGLLMLATTRSMSQHIADKIDLEHEIVGRIEVEERLAFAAFHDELTGLSNRALLMDRLKHVVAKRHTGDHLWAILFMDLDRFKVVNDSLGHGAGDLVLVETARRLELCLRFGDTLARLGGDEFIILLDGIRDVAEAAGVAKRVLRAFETPMTIAGREVFASASIGIATSRNGDATPEDVLRDADIAMFRAKDLGRQRFQLFSSDLLANAVARLEIETDLARALERNEFVLFYQPIVAMSDGRLVGFEALVRWIHPQRGLVPPDDFVGIIEENGAIVAIGEWILRKACRQLQEWRATFPVARDYYVNVNVSGRQLGTPGFAGLVQSALLDCKLSPERINIEITESVLIMDDADRARRALAELRSIGVRIHLDDFGTGYSSLAYLRDFEIDALKIDRSFVSGLGHGKQTGLASVEIVRTIIALAQSLKLTATAEGVETNEQCMELRALGCTNAQGYLFSRAVDATAAARLVADAQGTLAEVATPAAT